MAMTLWALLEAISSVYISFPGDKRLLEEDVEEEMVEEEEVEEEEGGGGKGGREIPGAPSSTTESDPGDGKFSA